MSVAAIDIAAAVAAVVVVVVGASKGSIAEGQSERRYPAATSASTSEGPVWCVSRINGMC